MTRNIARGAALGGAVTLLLATAVSIVGCSESSGGAAPQTQSTPSSPTTSGKAKQVLLIGDSIPYNSPDDCPGCTGFGDGFASALTETRGEPYAAVNRSRHDGARTGEILAQVNSGSLDADLASADIVVLSIGYNDQPPYDAGRACYIEGLDLDSMDGAIRGLKATTPECIATETARSAENLQSALKKIRERAPQATVLALTAYNAWTGEPGLDPKSPGGKAVTKTIVAGLKAWRTAVCSAAGVIEGKCVDLLAGFNGSDGATPSGDLLAADYTHPSQKGNDLIRDLLLTAAG